MGLNPSLHDPWPISGVLTNPSSLSYTLYLKSQIHVIIYVDDSVSYFSDQAQEELFQALIQEQIQVDFMVNVDYSLGTIFNCLKHSNGNISVHVY